MADEIEAEEELPDEQNQKVVEQEHLDLKVYTLINQDLSGYVEDIQDSYARVRLVTTEAMIADKRELVHSGFIFSAASFCAAAAINKPNTILAVAKCNFLAPIKVGDEIVFEARALHNATRKRNVSVTGTLLGRIKVFESEFSFVVTDKHPLSLTMQTE
ncbi:MAG: PaaI family thioesterase [Helicobacteraceae bacterium]|jgi:acyl-coenzyme A thioesterase PaaI-like protein|nr:PaaI family thioesterase [Helicobacteraceae bacterium]